MAYSSITKPTDHFVTKLYSGNGSTQSITGVGFQPDWTWIKARSGGTQSNNLYDGVRGATKYLRSDSTGAEGTQSNGLTSFDSDGFSMGADNGNNGSGYTYASWNWLAGGTAPAVTYSVKVVSDSGNKYRFDDFGTSAVTLDLQEGGTYTFDQSDSSNSGHPLRFSTTSDGSHGGGSEYTTGVTTTGTPGSSGAKTVITVAASAPTLYYYCTQHSGMGGQANTNSTFGSSNFSGSIQSKVSANTTAGFSIITYTGTGSNATVGHGLGAVPRWITIKVTNATNNWPVLHGSLGGTKRMLLDANLAEASASTFFNNTDPTSSVFSVGTEDITNNSGNPYIVYCFAEKQGYSKFGSFTGNGNADGSFIYTGFKPAWVIVKESSGTSNWLMFDNKRDPSNFVDAYLKANASDSEYSGSAYLDFLSNGFKCRNAQTFFNENSSTYIYLAFAENPFVANDSGTAVPVTAR